MVPSDRLIDEIIEPFCRCTDASLVGCWGITEPDHGTDTLSPFTPDFSDPEISGQTLARKEGDEWIIDGQKAAWVSNGTIATHCLLYPTIDPSMGMAGGGICIVPLDLPGVKKGRPLDKLGQRALNQGEIYFDGVRIPEEYMLVDPESYEAMLDVTLSTANAGMGALFVGRGQSGLRRSPGLYQAAHPGWQAAVRAPDDQTQTVYHVHQRSRPHGLCPGRP
jgi:alkylation response protein AidB-like acyl-CoA dehydrogenase